MERFSNRQACQDAGFVPAGQHAGRAGSAIRYAGLAAKRRQNEAQRKRWAAGSFNWLRRSGRTTRLNHANWWMASPRPCVLGG